MATTSKAVPYPVGGDSDNVPSWLLQLATFLDANPGVAVMSTTTRDALPSAGKWNGRIILNTTTGELEKYSTATTAWGPINDDATLNRVLLRAPQEAVTVSATAMGATVTYDALTQGALLLTVNATANSTWNIRGNATTTLAAALAVGESITVVLMVTNGATGYRPTAFQIDGAAITPKWAGGAAPSVGSPNAIDVYSLTIIKTAATPTYTVLGSYGRYA
ncbi:MAG: hypothetical protein F2667_00335 [Actinobacteria bacterium]|nr:hypothetical protein [Actinomycetota bacterium]